MPGAEDKGVGAAAEDGELCGIAFTLSDDLIDVLSESEPSGKTPGTDLREGIATLPGLLARDDAALVAVLVLLAVATVAKYAVTDDSALRSIMSLGLMGDSPPLGRITRLSFVPRVANPWGQRT